MREYDSRAIEEKWRRRWDEAGLHTTPDKSKKPKCYVLDMFPYPSGDGLHVGHPKGYIATDVYSRLKKMQGHEILHPMGWDAFGLPAENFAIQNKIHPRIAVEKNIARFKEQLGGIGFNYDWSREITTSDPAFYRWTQWIFLKLYERDLAYESYEPINWCPSCQTGLANEDLEQGRCERCGSIVEKRPMRQWVLKITDYAERLLSDLDGLAWPEHIKESQRNWIGKSEGAIIKFQIPDSKIQTSSNDANSNGSHEIDVFTTRPDTIFGATYVVLAPEHPLIAKLESRISNRDEVLRYVEEAKKKGEIERTAEGKEKTGVKLEGITAINPATKEEIPIFVADYVLGHYGTGAVMAVPAHDERDFVFAKKYGLPVRQVIAPHLISLDNPPREGKRHAPRIVVQGIVRHWENDTVLQIKWKKLPWKTFVIGGAEEGESLEEAVMREVREETGYKNIRSVRRVTPELRVELYVDHKDENRYAHMHAFEVVLANGERDELSPEEQE
ncbi:MAG TPA: class I tRNA ligase family protein, partial [Candidatus Paceibacterota bacterium]|nr:class I tRNA ligase family protein [Candidatus Paceibacterota bacterium]